MAYATLSDVQDRMPQFVLSETSKPSLTTAQTFLNDVQAEFESAMENLGYVVPITGPKALLQSKAIVCQGTIARILQARAAAVGGDAAVTGADRAQKIYDDKLMFLKSSKSPLELTDAVRTGSAVGKPSNTVLGLLFDEDGNDIEPHMTLDQEF